MALALIRYSRDNINAPSSLMILGPAIARKYPECESCRVRNNEKPSGIAFRDIGPQVTTSDAC